MILSTTNLIDKLKIKYPLMQRVLMCAWGVVAVYYTDKTMETEIGRSYYYPRENEGSYKYDEEFKFKEI
jgi:hypothetical protein